MPKSEKSKSAEVYLDDEKENGTTTTKVKKAKGFKRIRGLLKGESRKEKKARKEAEKAAALQQGSSQSKKAEPGDRSDDGSTVYGVQVDDASVTTGVSNNNNKGPRRSASRESLPSAAGDGRTVSSDATAGTNNKKGQAAYILKVVLLLMDPASRRFELLQLEFDSLKALVSDVLAQIPISVTEAALREQSYVGICGVDAKEMSSNKLLADFCVGNEVLVAVPSNISPKECVRLARPILSDEKVIAMLKSSGIDASVWRQVKKTPKKGSSGKTKSSDISRNLPDSVPEATENSESNENGTEHRSAGTDRNQNRSVGDENIENGGKGQGFVVSFFLIIFLTIIIQIFHLYISAPITPGGVVTPGHWLSRCGLYGFVNTTCVDAYLNVNKNGTVTLYDSEKNIEWQIEGETCKPKDDKCIPGMQFTKDKKILVGGKLVSYVTKFGDDTPMSPWPFEEAPLIKTWLKNQKILHKQEKG